MEAGEVDLDCIFFGELRLRGGAEERGLRLFVRRLALDALPDQEVGGGGDNQHGQATLGRSDEGMLGEGLAGREVGEGSEGGERVADTQEEVAVAEVPEVLSVVVQVP